jgi:hypothetical protein
MSNLPDRPLPVDADIEGHRARIQAAVEAYVGALKEYTDELMKRYRPQTRWHTGTCRSISVSSKTATVDLDPFPRATEQPGTQAGWGRKTWTAGQLVGKRVRVLIDTDSKQMWIDDVL